MAHASRVRASLDEKLLDIEAALRRAEGSALEAAVSAERLANRETELTASLAEVTGARDALALQVSVGAAALEAAQQDRTSEVAAAAELLTRREAELGAMLTEAAAARRAIEQTLANVEAAYQHAQHRLAAELATAAERQVELEQDLTQETTRCISLEETLASAEKAQQEAAERQASELAMASTRLAEVHARTMPRWRRLRPPAIATNSSCAMPLRTRKRPAAASVRGRRRGRAPHKARGRAWRHARGSDRRLEMGSRSASARPSATFQQADERSSAERTSAAEREAAVAAELQQEVVARQALEGQLAETRRNSAQARRRLVETASALRRRSRDRRARLETLLGEERSDRERQLVTKEAAIRDLEQERQTLQQSLGATREELQGLHDTRNRERQSYELAQSTSESDLRRLTAEHDARSGDLGTGARRLAGARAGLESARR